MWKCGQGDKGEGSAGIPGAPQKTQTLNQVGARRGPAASSRQACPLGWQLLKAVDLAPPTSTRLSPDFNSNPGVGAKPALQKAGLSSHPSGQIPLDFPSQTGNGCGSGDTPSTPLRLPQLTLTQLPQCPSLPLRLPGTGLQGQRGGTLAAKGYLLGVDGWGDSLSAFLSLEVEKDLVSSQGHARCLASKRGLGGCPPTKRSSWARRIETSLDGILRHCSNETSIHGTCLQPGF